MVPSTASAGALVKVVGAGFTSCAAANAEVSPSRNADLPLTASGDVSLFWNGMDPVAIVHLDEEFGFSANIEIAQSTPPGDHRLVTRCVSNAGDAADGHEEDTGSADFTVPPPPEVVAIVPGRNPVDRTASRPATSAVDAVLAAAGDTDGAGTTESASTSSVTPIPAEPEGGGALAVVPALSVTDPVPWGRLVGALLLAGAVVPVPLLIPLVLGIRRGPKWVRTNVRAAPGVAPAVSLDFTPQTDDSWLPTSVVRFALHADSGTQVVTEVKQ